MTQEEEKEIEELKEYFPLEVLNNEEIEHSQKLSENGYASVVKYLRNVHPEMGLKECKIYYDLYFNNETRR